MVPVLQHLRHLPAVPYRRAGIVGVFQQAVPVALVDEAAVVRQHPLTEAAHRVHHHQRPQLPAGEYKVADADLLVHDLVQHPLVHPFVVAAEQQQVLPVPGQLRRPLLGEHPALRGEEDDPGAVSQFLTHRLKAAVDGLRLHQHPLAAAVGRIIHPAVLVQRIVPDLPAVDVQLSGPPGPADDALPQHRFTHLREQRCDLNPHRQTVPPAA